MRKCASSYDLWAVSSNSSPPTVFYLLHWGLSCTWTYLYHRCSSCTGTCQDKYILCRSGYVYTTGDWAAHDRVSTTESSVAPGRVNKTQGPELHLDLCGQQESLRVWKCLHHTEAFVQCEKFCSRKITDFREILYKYEEQCYQPTECQAFFLVVRIGSPPLHPQKCCSQTLA